MFIFGDNLWVSPTTLLRGPASDGFNGHVDLGSAPEHAQTRGVSIALVEHMVGAQGECGFRLVGVTRGDEYFFGPEMAGGEQGDQPNRSSAKDQNPFILLKAGSHEAVDRNGDGFAEGRDGRFEVVRDGIGAMGGDHQGLGETPRLMDAVDL